MRGCSVFIYVREIMIPKTIHYIWLGGNPMPKIVTKCMDSWKKYCPDYEIKEWNEDNFNLDMYPYVREAYDNRKFAFVTDVVRLYALYTEGGVYMDTDVEVIKPLDGYLHHVAFSGFEAPNRVPTGIMASEKGGKWVKDNLDYYINKHFVKPNGELDLTTNVVFITDYMREKGLRFDNSYQDFPGLITLYPHEVFCPKIFVPEKLRIELHKTKDTATIHHFAGSWVPSKSISSQIRIFVSQIVGYRVTHFIQRLKGKRK